MERLLALNPVDLDARLIVGEQYVAAGSFTAALREFIKLAELALESSNPKLEARAHELQAKVYEQQSLPGKALEALKHSLEIRLGLRDDQAVAETLEALGDLYARRTRPARRAAVDCYQRSIEKFRECRNGVAVRRVQRMRDALVGVNQPEDTWASLLLRRVGNSMLKGAELLRVPVHTT